MKQNNQKRIKILFLLLLVFILIPKVLLAATVTTSTGTTRSSTYDRDYNILYVLEAPLGDTYIVNNIVDYFLIIYKFAVASAAILATIVIMAGGLMWAASAGNESQIGKAKELITGAVIGMILAVGSYLILSTINPALISLKALSPDYIDVDYFAMGTCGNKCKVDSECKGCNDGNATCINHLCAATAGDQPVGADCAAAGPNVCAEGLTCEGATGVALWKCSDGSEGSNCSQTQKDKQGNCQTGMLCREIASKLYQCVKTGSGKGNSEYCGDKSECTSGICFYGKCSEGKETDGCQVDSDCAENYECVSCTTIPNGCNSGFYNLCWPE